MNSGSVEKTGLNHNGLFALILSRRPKRVRFNSFNIEAFLMDMVTGAWRMAPAASSSIRFFEDIK